MAFEYKRQKFRFRAAYKNGVWNEGELSTESTIVIGECSPAIHYGQQCFEGLKAYKTKSGEINIFRLDQNFIRINESCKRLCIPPIPKQLFYSACKQVVKANKDSIPSYESSGSLYIRPLVIGVGNSIGLKPAKEYIFQVITIPVDDYFSDMSKDGINVCTTYMDRAATNGTGNVKVGGNYSASLMPVVVAKENGFDDCIYLDAQSHTKIEEGGTTNFFGITFDNKFVTPNSKSILNSITKRSIMHIAKNEYGMEVLEADCYIDNIDEFKEVAVCGTASSITPIMTIEHIGNIKEFYHGSDSITKLLKQDLLSIQKGDNKKYLDWLYNIDS